MDETYDKLKNIVTERFISNDINIRHAYSRTVDVVLQGVPEIVIRPKDAQEISEILKVANEEKIPVIPRGAGICEFGGSKPFGDQGIDPQRYSGKRGCIPPPMWRWKQSRCLVSS